MKKSVLAFAWLAVAVCAVAEEKKVVGPDGKLAVYVDLAEGGKPTYRVDYDGKAFLGVSPLGLNTNVGDFTPRAFLERHGDTSRVRALFRAYHQAERSAL